MNRIPCNCATHPWQQFSRLNFPGTISEKLKTVFRCKPKQQQTLRASALSSLQQFELHERRNDPVRTFSKGMKQRVNVASAIVPDPEILFLDEPTSGLDVQSQRLIRNIIKEMNQKGTTIFLTTHNIEEANILCERVGIINKGKIVAIDAPERLKRTFEENF